MDAGGQGSLQNTKTKTTCDQELLFTLHVEVPDDEPWQDSKREVGDDKPS
jgi:hypothetical protein